MTDLLSRDDILRGLGRLNTLAKAADVIVDIAVYDGAALVIAYNARVMTRDVDAVIHGNVTFIKQACRIIAEEEGWPDGWLNDGVKGFISASEALEPMLAEGGGDGEGVRVYVPTAEYLFAMKCMAMRPEGVDGSHDISDIKFLANEIGIESAGQAFEMIEQFYPASKIPPKVRFGVEEILETALAERATKPPTSPAAD